MKSKSPKSLVFLRTLWQCSTVIFSSGDFLKIYIYWPWNWNSKINKHQSWILIKVVWIFQSIWRSSSHLLRIGGLEGGNFYGNYHKICTARYTFCEYLISGLVMIKRKDKINTFCQTFIPSSLILSENTTLILIVTIYFPLTF